MNLPYETYLKDSVVTLYGGVVSGIHTLNISLGGAFIAHPKAKQVGGDESQLVLNRQATLTFNSCSAESVILKQYFV